MKTYMYISLPVEEMNALEKENEKKIKQFYMLPFWKRWGKHELLKQEIIESWRDFELKHPYAK